jgi:hypothetical protein
MNGSRRRTWLPPSRRQGRASGGTTRGVKKWRWIIGVAAAWLVFAFVLAPNDPFGNNQAEVVIPSTQCARAMDLVERFDDKADEVSTLDVCLSRNEWLSERSNYPTRHSDPKPDVELDELCQQRPSAPAC